MDARTGRQYGLLDCALLAISGGCPPEGSMYLCRFGEMDTDAEMDCESCWRNYLLYVAAGRRHDPYLTQRVDA